MKLVNGCNLSGGGGLTILRNFYLFAPVDTVFVVNNSDVKKMLEAVRSDGPQFVVPPRWVVHPVAIFFLYGFWIGRQAKRWGCSEIISLGNIASMSPLKQILYLHWPYFAYGLNAGAKAGLFDRFRRFFRFQIIRLFARCADRWVVQTEAMRKQLVQKSYANDVTVDVVYPGFEREFTHQDREADHSDQETGALLRLIYPSLYYSHKNFLLLVKLANRVDSNRLPFRFSVTLPHQKFEELGFDKVNCVSNLGILKQSELDAAYRSHDALIMPTKLETFGLPYLEAMAFGLPIVTSDRDFSRDICRQYAFYFDPDDVNSALEAVLSFRAAIEDGRDFKAMSIEELTRFPSWSESVSKVFSLGVDE